MIKVECKVQIQNDDYDKLNDPKALVVVTSHWNYDSYVILKVNDGEEVTVYGRDLIIAVENSMRSKRF